MNSLNWGALCLRSLWVLSVALSFGFGLWHHWGFRAKEERLKKAFKLGMGACWVLSFGLFVHLLRGPSELVKVSFGDWIQSGSFSFRLDAIVDLFQASVLVMVHLLLFVIVRFAATYLHRDPGYQRFLTLLMLFQNSILIVVTADHFDFLVFGWELMGLVSVLLIGFFSEQYGAGRQSFRTFMNYKFADIGMILAAVLLHDFHKDLAFETLPQFVTSLHEQEQWTLLTLVGGCLIFGSLAKGGLIPFSSWIPRAMEGPTPSSALFYGALSVHMAPLLLLRTQALWQWSSGLRWTLGGIGVATALSASFTAKTCANIKGQLGYWVMAHIGLIYGELALGWGNIAAVHMLLHACVRILQFMRSPSLLQDTHDQPSLLASPSRKAWMSWRSSSYLQRCYVHAWNGFYVEAFLHVIIIKPVLALASFCHWLMAPIFFREREFRAISGVSRLPDSGFAVGLAKARRRFFEWK